MAPTNGHPDFVRLYNPPDAPPYENWYNGVRRRIEPGESLVANWDHACGWLGDPTLYDTGRERPRTQEYMRLRVMYGVYEKHELDHQLPQLQVFHPVEEPPERQQRIHMILDDPDARRVPSFNAPAPVTTEDRIAALERALAAERALREGSGSDVADGGTSDPGNRKGKSKGIVTDNTVGLADLEPDQAVRPGVMA